MNDLTTLEELGIPINRLMKEKYYVEQGLKLQVANNIISNYDVKFNQQWIDKVVFYEKVSHYISKKHRQRFLKRYEELLSQKSLLVTTSPLPVVKNIKVNFVVDHSYGEILYQQLKE